MLKWWQNMIVGLAEIFDGLMSIVTFGHRPDSLSFVLASRFSIQNLKKEREKE